MERSRSRMYRRGATERQVLIGRLCKALARWWPAFRGPVRAPKPCYTMELIEPRLLLSADLTYATLDTAPATVGDIPAYAASLVSTNYTLKAENDSGNLFWRLYGTGTDLVGIPPTKVLEFQIDDATDLDVNVKRSDLGFNQLPAGLSLIDFVGDKLTLDLDSLSVLDAQFGGTTIDLDFAGGKDLDIGAIVGIAIPSPLNILDDQVILAGNGGTFANHGLKIHSSSDIVNEAGGVQVTATGGDVEVKSDSKVTIDAGSNVVAPNISILADATGSALVKGLLANAAGAVKVDDSTLTAAGGTVTLQARGTVDMTGSKAEDGDTFFGNTIAGTLVTSFSTATVDVVGNTTINAATLAVLADVHTDIVATVQDGTVKLLSVWAAADPRVTIGDGTGNTVLNLTDTVTAEAKSTLSIDASSKPGNANNASVDAAIVNVNVVDVGIPVIVPAGFTSGSDITIGGNAAITAANGASFKATDSTTVTTTADGTVASTAGATLAVTVVDVDSTARITGNAAVTAPTVELLAASTRALTTTAKSTPGGSQDDNDDSTQNDSQKALQNNNAKTSDGDLTIAAAVAVSHVGGTTSALVDSTNATSAVTATTSLTVGATATDSASAIATGEGTGSPGISIAAAINLVDIDVAASLGANLKLASPTVNVSATLEAADTFKAEATSGAGSDGVGIAGALAINKVATSVRAFVDNAATVNLNGGTLNLSATSNTHSVADAKPKKVSGSTVGIGASVAIDIVDTLTEAALESGAVLFFPSLPFTLSEAENAFLDAGVSDGKAKNISLDHTTGKMQASSLTGEKAEALAAMRSKPF